jgi:tRNA-Thr(GGU) m(6)t(6)A37 methyltransferase TsaA
MELREFTVQAVGVVSSPLGEPANAPRQADEGAPRATIQVADRFRPAAADLQRGDRVVLLTWLHLAERDVLVVHPRGDRTRPEQGVFSTRSQHRPNPIGLHEVEVVEVSDHAIVVSGLEAVDGTPVLDIKPVLGPTSTR